MSIYIGNNGSNKVLHIYNGSSNIEKNNFSGTSFHSSMPYLVLSSIHRFTQNGTTPYSNPVFTSVGYSTTNPLPPMALDGSTMVLAVGVIGSTRYFFPSASCSPYWAAVPQNVTTFGNINTTGINFAVVNNSTGFCGRYSTYPSDTMYFDYIDLYVINDINTVSPSDISITSSDIKINNSSIFEPKYCVFLDSLSMAPNTYDTILAIPYATSSLWQYGGNYVTSTSNTQYSDVFSNGGHYYIQILNSYNYPVQSTIISANSTESYIGNKRNNIETKLFSSLNSFYTSTLVYGQYLLVPQGTKIYDNNVHLISTINVNIDDGNIINFGMYKTTNLFVNFTTFKITNGAVYYIYSEYYNWIHIQFDTINNKIYVYWQSGRTDQSAGVSLLFNVSFYAFIRVMA